MKRFKSIAIATLAALIAVVYAVPAPSAFAESSSLSIAPKKNYVIEPGETVNDTLTIRNLDASGDLTLNLTVIDFTYTDDGGTPKLLLDQDLAPTTWSLKPFLTVPETVTVAPGGSKTLDISTAIPAGHGAGSYYSAILYSTGAPDGGNVGLAASGVTLVFVTIPGQVNEKLTLENFGVYRPAVSGQGAKYQSVTADMPMQLGYTLKNEGNVTESPVGSITLKYMFGEEQVINNINSTGSLALIGQTRTFTTCIKLASQDVNFQGTTSQTTTCANPGLWPGMYTATLDAFYGQNGNRTQEIIKTVTFWYLPWWFVIGVIVILATLALVIWRLVVKIRTAMYGPAHRARRPRTGRR